MKLLSIFLISLLAFADYPASWWQHIPEDQKKSWEFLPQEAGEGEVILSKRTELGVFSNLSHTPFTFDGIHYESLEALWQSLKYPDSQLENDPRTDLPYTTSREAVYESHGFASKDHGDEANAIMREYGIKFVSYKGKQFDYKDLASGSDYHYQLISAAMKSKVLQNPALKSLLKQTKGLKLRPDHHIRDSRPASYFYHKILMDIRKSL